MTTTATMTDLEQAADYINKSRTGSIATLHATYVSVQIPGLTLLSNGKTAPYFSVERVYSLRGAIRLIMSMT